MTDSTATIRRGQFWEGAFNRTDFRSEALQSGFGAGSGKRFQLIDRQASSGGTLWHLHLLLNVDVVATVHVERGGGVKCTRLAQNRFQLHLGRAIIRRR
jgi:hypothetical protein